MSKAGINKIFEKAAILLFLLWGSASFFLFLSPDLIKISVLVFTLLTVCLVLAGIGDLFSLLFLLFVNLYAFYGLSSTYNLPLFLVMIGLSVVSGISFYSFCRKTISDNLALYTLLFMIFILELYLALSFWLINPLTRSTIIVIFAYLFSGYLLSVKKGELDFKIVRSYLLLAACLLLILILTVSWGR